MSAFIVRVSLVQVSLNVSAAPERSAAAKSNTSHASQSSVNLPKNTFFSIEKPAFFHIFQQSIVQYFPLGLNRLLKFFFFLH